MTDVGPGKSRLVIWITLAGMYASVLLRSWILFSDVRAVAAIGVGTVLVSVVMAAGLRHHFKAIGLRDSRRLSMEAAMVFAAMPPEWQGTVVAAADKQSRKYGECRVTVRAVDDFVVIEKAWDPLFRHEPFEARFPLAAIADIVVGPSVRSVVGSTMTFRLGSGGAIRFDVGVGSALAERVAQRFRDAADAARGSGPTVPAVLDVSTL